jgi:hypothetical protein
LYFVPFIVLYRDKRVVGLCAFFVHFTCITLAPHKLYWVYFIILTVNCPYELTYVPLGLNSFHQPQNEIATNTTIE